MAGIGFSLRAMRLGGTYGGELRRLSAAAFVCGGPWSVATLAMFAIGRAWVADPSGLAQFRIVITWLVAASVVWTAPLSWVFTRFIADCEYAGEREAILPNLCGALVVTSASGALLAAGLGLAYPALPGVARVWLGVAFTCTCDAWLVATVLASLREHRSAIACFALGYALTAIASAWLARTGVAGLCGCFALGQAALTLSGWFAVARSVRARPTARPRLADARGVAFLFLRWAAAFPALAFAGLAYNVGCWADELVFWLDPTTGRAVLGPLRGSLVYDLPNLAASACALPGLAVFVVHVETEFADRQRRFFDAVLSGETLGRLEALAEALTDAARDGIWAVIRTQAAVALAWVLLGPSLLGWLNGSSARSLELQLPLFYACTLAAALQMVVLAALNLLFYLDRLRLALGLCALVCASNVGLSWLSLRWGPVYYGAGGVLASGLACVSALAVLNRAFAHLVRDTFMLQPAAARSKGTSLTAPR